MATANIRVSGPLLTGAMPGRVKRFLQAVVDEVALQHGIAVVDQLKRDVKKPTPYYWTMIDVKVRGDLVDVVTDQGVVYGPWLAGVSRRNAATRFKGYQHWRLATQRVRRKVYRIGTDLFHILRDGA